MRLKLVVLSLIYAVCGMGIAGAQEAPEVDQSDRAKAAREQAEEQEQRTKGKDSKAKTSEGGAAAGESEKRSDDGLVQLPEVVVEAKRPLSAASSDEIRAQDYELRPHATTMEILNNVPGLVVAQHQGGGKAAQYLIRGFDADHGTDFAVFVDDLPVNLVSHAHGQGYADLNFLIPETVDRLRLYKGPYFAELGDFATGGALRIITKDEFEENFARAEGGSFDTQRYVLGGSPPLSWAKTLVAAEAYFSNGPFDNPQNLSRYNVFTKLTLSPTTDHVLSLSGSVYASDWDASGQIPLREVKAGQLDRFGSIDPTEGGKTDRENLNLQYTYAPSDQETWWFQLYGSRYSLRLYSDFTFTGRPACASYRGRMEPSSTAAPGCSVCPSIRRQTTFPGTESTRTTSVFCSAREGATRDSGRSGRCLCKARWVWRRGATTPTWRCTGRFGGSASTPSTTSPSGSSP